MGRPWGKSSTGKREDRTSAPPLRGETCYKLDKAQRMLQNKLRQRPNQAVTIDYALDELIEKLEAEGFADHGKANE